MAPGAPREDVLGGGEAAQDEAPQSPQEPEEARQREEAGGVEEEEEEDAPSHLPFAPSSELLDDTTTVDPSYTISLIRQLLPRGSNVEKEFSVKQCAPEEKDANSGNGESAQPDYKDPWEECGCILWDLAASKPQAELMMNNLVLEVLLANLHVTQSSRVKEICLGILGNLACHESLVNAISLHDGLTATVVDQLFLDDSACLSEIFRFLAAVLRTNVSVSWAEALLPDEILSRVLWIDGNTLNSTLLERKWQIRYDGVHLRVRCCAHILNILVQDGLTIADASIEMTRDLIRHINSSPRRIQAFNEIAEREGLAPKAGLVLDVSNRWNSTHAMIIEAVKYKMVLKRYAASNQEPFPSDDEWTKIDAIGEYLGAFEEATRAFSANRHPTAHMFLDNVLCIHQALKNPEWQTNEAIQNLARAMESKFNKYWDGNYNMALVIASILDPRQKLEFLEFFYQKVCDYFVDVDTSMSIAREWMTKYFRKYEEVVRTNGAYPVVHTTVSRGSVGSPMLDKRSMHQEFVRFKTQKRASSTQK